MFSTDLARDGAGVRTTYREPGLLILPEWHALGEHLQEQCSGRPLSKIVHYDEIRLGLLIAGVVLYMIPYYTTAGFGVCEGQQVMFPP